MQCAERADVSRLVDLNLSDQSVALRAFSISRGVRVVAVVAVVVVTAAASGVAAGNWVAGGEAWASCTAAGFFGLKRKPDPTCSWSCASQCRCLATNPYLARLEGPTGSGRSLPPVQVPLRGPRCVPQLHAGPLVSRCICVVSRTSHSVPSGLQALSPAPHCPAASPDAARSGRENLQSLGPTPRHCTAGATCAHQLSSALIC